MDIIGDGHTVTELKASTDKSSFHFSFRLFLSSSPNPFCLLQCVQRIILILSLADRPLYATCTYILGFAPLAAA